MRLFVDVYHYFAFSDGGEGGNPAGVSFWDVFPKNSEMCQLAAELGYSESVFARPEQGGFRVRYFSPESEIPFCGHATLALGAALCEHYGGGQFELTLNDAKISVCGEQTKDGIRVSLKSPPTQNSIISDTTYRTALDVFGYTDAQINTTIPPARIYAGADHLVLSLKSRSDLARMRYDMEACRTFMIENNFVTVMLVWQESDRLFCVRNAFASSGIFEDPATGAAAAAFAGYLRDKGLSSEKNLVFLQGQDMGMPSRLLTHAGSDVGGAITVSGMVRPLSISG